MCENRRSKNTKNELLVFPDNIIWEGQEWWEHGASLFLRWTGQVSTESEIRKEDKVLWQRVIGSKIEFNETITIF